MLAEWHHAFWRGFGCDRDKFVQRLFVFVGNGFQQLKACTGIV
jgi:hypothetical protein